jgi:hypothetical protein
VDVTSVTIERAIVLFILVVLLLYVLSHLG